MAGSWFLLSDGEKTAAYSMLRGERVLLEGELHSSVWADGEKLGSLSRINPVFAELAEAARATKSAATLSHALRGPEGWGVLFVELTGKCNESCRHCYARSSPRVTEALDWEVAASVIRSARELDFGCIQFIGGDPLISPHIEAAVELAGELGIPKIEVFTNGLALHEPLLELFARRGVHMAFSVYSHDPAVHDAVTRTPGSHERTSRAIVQSLGRGLPVRVAGVEGCVSGQDEVALRAYLVELGVAVDKVWVDRQRPVGRGAWTEETKLLEGAPVTRHADKGFPNRGKLCVTYSGKLVPCIFDRETVLGDVRRMGLSEILSSGIQAKPMKRQLQTVGEPLACGDCRERRDLLAGLTWDESHRSREKRHKAERADD